MKTYLFTFIFLLSTSHIYAQKHNYYDTGMLKYNSGNYQEAIVYFDSAIRINPTNDSAFFRRANCEGELNLLDREILDYDTALEINPKHITVYYHRGHAKRNANSYQEAIKDFNIYISLYDSVYAYFAYADRAICKERINNREGAIADFDTAIKISPKISYAYHNRGRIQDDLGRRKEALADFDIAINLDPTDADSYWARANTERSLQDYKDALLDYDTTISLDSNNAYNYSDRGWTEGYLKDYGSAIKDYSKAIDLKKNYEDFYFFRAVAESYLKKLVSAFADYDTAVKLSPKDARVYYNRGNLEKFLKKKNEACADWHTAVGYGSKGAVDSIKNNCESFRQTLTHKFLIGTWNLYRDSLDKDPGTIQFINNKSVKIFDKETPKELKRLSLNYSIDSLSDPYLIHLQGWYQGKESNLYWLVKIVNAKTMYVQGYIKTPPVPQKWYYNTPRINTVVMKKEN